MRDGDLNPVLCKRAVADLPAPVGAEDDERAFGALLGPDSDEGEASPLQRPGFECRQDRLPREGRHLGKV